MSPVQAVQNKRCGTSPKRDRFPKIIEATPSDPAPGYGQRGQSIVKNLRAFLTGEHGHADLSPAVDKSLVVIVVTVIAGATAASLGLL